ncbi:hypothetical protein D8674_019302 [Pyrus ussuriensis x Pyrus communis]|uniref:Uncharacterized protein n=1 Tax=Pyrus ussuriensis x Pyrus communis TaxID=2448454 RepID=A0A5N5GCN1_9ROSA|nr:hypothetical protein D8674_019302 [Pyrus ussuriensis x Pyrus communis]
MTTRTTVATTLAEMDHRLVNPINQVGPPVPQAPTSLTSSVPDMLISVPVLQSRCRHRDPQLMPRLNTKKNTWGPCRQLKTAKTNYNFDDIYEDMLVYLNRLFSERYKQWKSNLHQYFEMFDDLQVALEEGCLNEFEDRQDSWVWLCSQFQKLGYVEGSKFPEINIFADVYVWPEDELTESLHPSVPSGSVSPIFLHHHHQSPSTPSMHSNQTHRSSTPSLTPPPSSSKITKHLRTTCP